MGNSNTGNQRFVNAAYKYIQINGPSSLHQIINYVHDILPSSHGSETNSASSLLAIHPMFRTIGQTRHKGMTNTYSVALLDIVPEEVVVAKLALSIHTGKSLYFAFRKYPAFIKKQVNALLDSPDFNPTELQKMIDDHMEMLDQEE